MSRPQKCRRVCRLPRAQQFCPDIPFSGYVQLTIDEFETLRLIDKEGLTQQECAAAMQIARATAQQIYAQARSKLATALVDGLGVRIQGGNYNLCPVGGHCKKGACNHCQKGDLHNMIIAIPYQPDGRVFAHFGHTEQFKLYTEQEGQITYSKVVSAAGSGHGALAGMLQALGVNVLICGGIGDGAKNALAAAGIAVYPGVQGSADTAATQFVQGNLQYNPNTHCDHHHGDSHCNGHCQNHC